MAAQDSRAARRRRIALVPIRASARTAPAPAAVEATVPAGSSWGSGVSACGAYPPAVPFFAYVEPGSLSPYASATRSR
ncbi:hypothetical protein SNARM312S_04559 [Streptomyces narbonensis]